MIAAKIRNSLIKRSFTCIFYYALSLGWLYWAVKSNHAAYYCMFFVGFIVAVIETFATIDKTLNDGMLILRDMMILNAQREREMALELFQKMHDSVQKHEKEKEKELK